MLAEKVTTKETLIKDLKQAVGLYEATGINNYLQTAKQIIKQLEGYNTQNYS